VWPQGPVLRRMGKKWARIELRLSPRTKPVCRFVGNVGNEGKLSASAYEQIWIELTVVFDANDEP
jgi:hypothetical protein